MSAENQPARVLIAVTHLLGSGHLVRAAQLARALAEGGFDVTLASGGMPLREMGGETFAFVQLPPVKVEGLDFRKLLDEAGTAVDAGRLARRRAMLAALATTLRPDVVVTEHFPFGRRQLAEEFLTLITAAKAANPSALVLASVRDVLVTPRPDRIAEAEQRLCSCFDGVLVHGDRSFLPLEASWPVSPALAERLHYTGYLAPPPVPAPVPGDGEGAGDVIVSGGGSAAALPLFRLCLEAARLCEPSRRWRILVGKGVAEGDVAALRQSASPNVTIERARADFPALLARAALSVSQAGYNTVLDLVAAGRPAIVVPFDEGAETEQAIRAAAMEKAGLARCLSVSGPEPASPADLATAVAAALAQEAPARPTIDLGGAERVAGLLTRLLAASKHG
ncbi:MAG: glycosyltransferase [Bosea sp. (in: a-proteobacteria)]|uniref:glycosyltransferase family protein n=1 Tax=Bosea sp. (in: a-proteobacteria) TaxID=1871050 RepID=UPI0027355EEE|nr:glycosyltransferase [Bosea sp. (in: a-proteobacteria)]MDP3254615.1 glycosyltransferase [Bosea sp. (in: a-proteobacteria)]MDP3319133.1 glycosyltransferase [Bosea sp. (in: a-proteobacteria)]